MTIAQIVIMTTALALVIIYEANTRADNNKKADFFELQMLKQYECILKLLNAKVDSDGKARKAILDAIDRRNCEVFNIKQKLDSLDRTWDLKNHIRRLLKVRSSWMNKTISDAEAMKKISDMLAEIREKEKLE